MSAALTNECPACGAAAQFPGDHRIAHCKGCSHRWMPMTQAEQTRAELAIYTREYAGYRQDGALDANFDRLISEALVPQMVPGSVILDVGCGGGAFLAAAQRAGLSASGLDISEEAAQLVRDRGYAASAGDFTQTDGQPAVGVITMWDVLEHLRTPHDFLDAAVRRLTPNGIFVAKVPTYGALSVVLSDRIARLRRVLLGAPDHVQYYTRDSLRALFDRSGLQVVEWRELPGGIRTAPKTGGFRKKIARRTKSAIAAISGESNMLVVARNGT
ncbi:methyltransferase domain-containing protein [Altererythrobacter aerius]|uniref:Methyltransferase domain-containing protein n=1 Tax=Tsuneonella aeria TaxID=1837929 RepID=A0A6I4TEL0_9SPHN|nr:class I SAM-dependent methyltransferase [Tsuneonella aeria]MXO75503.1 methyltransferase domain-containing protein [Tsuneonella aeria]